MASAIEQTMQLQAQHARYFITGSNRLRIALATPYLQVTLSRCGIARTLELDEIFFDAPTPTCLEIHLMQGTKYQRFSTASIKNRFCRKRLSPFKSSENASTIPTNSSKNQLDRQGKQNSDIVQYAQAQRSKRTKEYRNMNLATDTGLSVDKIKNQIVL